MANKGFGANEINLVGVAGTPAIDSYDNLILGANTVFVEGEVIAQRFYGDGSGLTNIGAFSETEGYWEAAAMGPILGISTLSAVGIGVDPNLINSVNVESKLTISGGDITVLGDNASLNFYSSTVNADVNTGIRFFEGTADTQPRMAIDYNGSDGVPSTGHLEIKGTNNDAGDSYNILVSINRYGHVGIGSTIPRHALDVIGNTILSGVTTVGLANTSNPPFNSQMSFELTSNTNLRIRVRGTDGVMRTANITLS